MQSSVAEVFQDTSDGSICLRNNGNRGDGSVGEMTQSAHKELSAQPVIAAQAVLVATFQLLQGTEHLLCDHVGSVGTLDFL
jgi:hypothetical protein